MYSETALAVGEWLVSEYIVAVQALKQYNSVLELTIIVTYSFTETAVL